MVFLGINPYKVITEGAMHPEFFHQGHRHFDIGTTADFAGKFNGKALWQKWRYHHDRGNELAAHVAANAYPFRLLSRKATGLQGRVPLNSLVTDHSPQCSQSVYKYSNRAFLHPGRSCNDFALAGDREIGREEPHGGTRVLNVNER